MNSDQNKTVAPEQSGEMPCSTCEQAKADWQCELISSAYVKPKLVTSYFCSSCRDIYLSVCQQINRPSSAKWTRLSNDKILPTREGEGSTKIKDED